MRKSFLFALLTLCSAVCFADAGGEATKTAEKKTPYIEYHNRMVVFSTSHLAYERIRTNALYTGVESWAVFTTHSRLLAEGEFRMGYNFFWNGRDHFTPIAGVGFVKDFGHSIHHHHHHNKPGIVYGTVGFLYDHEFNTIFNLGLNVKALLGGPVSKKHFNWGSPVGGLDVSLPITFRFGHRRHWDCRVEPFNLLLGGSKEVQNYFGFRSTIGYRF